MSKLMSGSPWLETGGKEVTVKDAVQGTINSGAALIDGHIETLQDKVEKQAEMIAALMQLLVDSKVLTLEQIAITLSYGYSVEE